MIWFIAAYHSEHVLHDNEYEMTYWKYAYIQEGKENKSFNFVIQVIDCNKKHLNIIQKVGSGTSKKIKIGRKLCVDFDLNNSWLHHDHVKVK